MNNLLTNPYLAFTLGDLLFEKESVHEPIANNLQLSPARRATAMNQLVLIDYVLEMFEAAIQLEMDVTNKTGVQVIEAVSGKSVADMIKGDGLATKAAVVTLATADTLRIWLNKGASWIAEKTNKV
jgi:hypothetical protein